MHRTLATFSEACFLAKTYKIQISGFKIWDLTGLCGRLCWVGAKHYICCSVFYTELSPTNRRMFSKKRIVVKFRCWKYEIWRDCVGDCVELTQNLVYVVMFSTRHTRHNFWSVFFLTKTNKFQISRLNKWDLTGVCGRLCWVGAKRYICCSAFYTELMQNN